MVTLDLLRNPSVKRWLGGVEPAWSLLDKQGFSALMHPPSTAAGCIRLATDLSPDEIGTSAVARNALILLLAASARPGLKLTATGNLSRKVVAEMWEVFAWPDLDKAEARRFHKVINEPDFMPLFFVRHVVEIGKLLRRSKDHLKTTTSGLRFTENPGRQALQALLFHMTFWQIDLSYLGRGLFDGWPQRDIGIVLWSLSVAANEWQSRERLTRLCTIPIDGVLDDGWDRASYAMEAIILRPLLWFGLLEHRTEANPEERHSEQHFYRKAPLFDRFLSFDVRLEAAAGPRH